MGNCVSNSGAFEPPGSKAVAEFIQQHERETDPRWIAVRIAEERAKAAGGAGGGGGMMTEQPKKPKGPLCSICRGVVVVGVNPWQRTKSDKFVLDLADSDDEGEGGQPESSAAVTQRRAAKLKKLDRHGIALQPCKHVFCGACLSDAICRNLRTPFDPSTYGEKAGTSSTSPTTLQNAGRMEFPMGCPTCQVKPGEAIVEISDMTARLVLGEPNMDPWNHARFLSTLNLIYCPHKGCGEAFDADDVAPPLEGASAIAKNLVQCPRCKNSLCKSCKVVWHDRYSCEDFLKLPLNERNPEDLLFYEIAAQEKWRRCPKCSAMVELKFGCNHITCTCKHHFCYQCGSDFEHKGGKYQCKGGKGCKVWEEENLLERR
ncbi:hypothetical protein BDY24DRAFT_242911 [Mrakia frigida]|uniref:BRcat and Rcat domain-containing protein n=1 Tax=Mrakia frigida TaxID=29902 RepID=UPI003FCC17DC